MSRGAGPSPICSDAGLKNRRGRPAANREERMARVKRVVVKIGSSSVAGTANELDRRLMGRLVNDVVELRKRGMEVAIVSSGAVAAGMGRLELAQRPRATAELQATAAVGQNLLMHAYESLFRRHGVPVGQVLLTAGDILENRQRYVNLRNTFRQLFAYGVVPVINENDSVAVAELKRSIGENDMLAAYVANLVHAELLVVLSDVEGLYSAYGAGGQRGEVIGEVGADDADIDGYREAMENNLIERQERSTYDTEPWVSSTLSIPVALTVQYTDLFEITHEFPAVGFLRVAETRSKRVFYPSRRAFGELRCLRI